MNDSKKAMVAGIWLAFRDTLEAYNAPDQVVESVRKAAQSLDMSTEEIEYIRKEWATNDMHLFDMVFGDKDEEVSDEG